ncbi:MAG: sugar phosphate isomerase/epimerase [Anaerolineae bacterium]|nr:sugar phosphate isomerase/epimerase [Anaerolineae bacterium]MDW8072414.1 hypothetical protein [Anaerolineae bacterium]
MIKIAATIGTPDLRTETLAFYRGDVATAVRKVAALGYDSVEFMLRDPAQLDGIQLRRWSEEHNLQLATICTGHVYDEDGLGSVGLDLQVRQRAMQCTKSIVGFAATYFDSFREAGGLCWFVRFAGNNRHWLGSAHLDFVQIVRVLNEMGYSGRVSTGILPWPDPDTVAQATIAS